MSKTFVAEDGDSINCPSSWQSNRSFQENSSQTAGLTYVEKGSQSKSASSTEVQTDSAGGTSTPHVDLSKLAAWLTKITPKVLDELEKNRKSRVFDDYKLQEKTDDSIKLMFELNLEKDHPQFNFRTSAIDWSSTGGIFAVSRCAKEHLSWCEHSGCILLHQINSHESADSPHSSLDVSACVTTLCAHPSDSFILACGTFSGEVVVWNLQRDDPIVIGSITYHTEAVIHMEWVQNFDVTQTRPILVSASRDGSIIVWTMKTVSGTLKASLCFVLRAEKDSLDLGILCTKFNPSRPSSFLVGLEGGSVAICSSDSRRPCIGKKLATSQDFDCYDPVLHILDGHKGAVTGVQWVPASKDLFLTCGTDSELHVYSISELNLIRIIHLFEPSCGLEVCPSHPHIALTWGASGGVELLNVFSGKKLPPLEMANDGDPVSAVRLRTASSQLLALGNTDGKVSVWQIPHSKFSTI